MAAMVDGSVEVRREGKKTDEGTERPASGRQGRSREYLYLAESLQGREGAAKACPLARPRQDSSRSVVLLNVVAFATLVCAKGRMRQANGCGHR